MLLVSTEIFIEDEDEVFVSPCGDLFAERAAVAREIIWLVVREKFRRRGKNAAV